MLVDTNVLLRVTQTAHPAHALAVYSITALLHMGEPLLVTIEKMAEFWSVATRPETANGLGLSIEEESRALAEIEQYVLILSETQDSYKYWRTLVAIHRVTGADVHDIRLVAVMRQQGDRSILTFDDGLRRIPEIAVVHPRDVRGPTGIIH